MLLTFGKYRGRQVEEIAASDPDYLRWCLDKATVLDGKPFLKDQIKLALENRKDGILTPTGAAAPDQAVMQALNRLRLENARLSMQVNDAAKVEKENEALRQENAQLMAEKISLRRAGLNGQAASVKEWWNNNFKTIAKLAHPDKTGGATTELMALLNELNAKMK